MKNPHDPPPSMPPSARTLEAVAVAAGVSKMTVSRVLRHPERVAEGTRQRVLECIKVLSYRPNPLISTLMASTRQRRVDETNASIVFFISIPKKEVGGYAVVRRLFEGALARSQAKGYDLVMHSLTDERVPGERFTQIIKARGIEGIIFGPLSVAHSRLFLEVEPFACVACGFSLMVPAVHRVATNQMELASSAYRQAEARGYRRIGVVVHPMTLMGIRQQWLSALLFDLRRSENKIPLLDQTVEDKAGFMAWMKRWRPDCVIGSAAVFHDWLLEAGFSPPSDIGFILLGKESHQTAFSGPEKNYEGIGAAAVDVIAQQLHDNERGVPRFRKTVLLDPRWVEGGQTVRPLARPL